MTTHLNEEGIVKTHEEKVEERLAELEKFKYKVELGGRWLLCILYAVGAVIATVYYLLGIVHWKP